MKCNEKIIAAAEIIAAVAIIGAAIVLWVNPGNHHQKMVNVAREGEGTTESAASPATTMPLYMGSTTFRAQIADTDAERIQGLSGRPSLSRDEALIFVFDAPGNWGIWMKDMNFPIDIIWADSEKRVVRVEENASPDSYPKSFYPGAPSLYVVEVAAGVAREAGIVSGGKINF